MKPTRDFLFFLIVTIFTCLTNSLSNDKVICHVYGDPHLITFNDSTNEQFSCRTPGNLTLLSNEFLRIQIQIENETSAIQQVNSIRCLSSSSLSIVSFSIESNFSKTMQRFRVESINKINDVKEMVSIFSYE